VIVDKLDVLGIIANPAKAESPLAVDADAELSSAISLQSFQSVAWRHAQIIQCRRSVELLHLCKRLACETG
jgi:hypothetical protein